MNRGPLVILVEDSPTQSMRMTQQLRNHGIQVVQARDGVEGLQATSKLKPDAVLLDVRLPLMDGYQVARRLKRNPATADIPIIMLTILGETKDLVKGLDHGADYYIPKGANAADEVMRTLKGFGLIAWR